MGYIIKTIILTVIVLAVIYIFIFRRIRRKRSQTFDTVQDYHDTYINKESLKPFKNNRSVNSSGRYTVYSADSGTDNYTNKFVTKYNSTEDYREVGNDNNDIL